MLDLSPISTLPLPQENCRNLHLAVSGVLPLYNQILFLICRASTLTNESLLKEGQQGPLHPCFALSC